MYSCSLVMQSSVMLTFVLVLFLNLSTAEGVSCFFPFEFEGKTYHTCITKDHNQYWCYTDAEFSSWKNCPAGLSEEREQSVYVMSPVSSGTQTIDKTSGYIVSHRGYNDEDYPRNTDTTLLIPETLGKILTIEFPVFQLQNNDTWSGQCVDYLRIGRDGIKYCGNELQGRRWRTNTAGRRDLELRFKTNGYWQYAGFLIKYEVFSGNCNTEKLSVFNSWKIRSYDTMETVCKLAGSNFNEQFTCTDGAWEAEDEETRRSPCYLPLTDELPLYRLSPGQIHHQTSETSGYVISHKFYSTQNYTANIDSILTINNLVLNSTLSVTFLQFDLYYYDKYPGCSADYLQLRGDGVNKTVCSDPEYQPQLNQAYNVPVRSASMTFRFKTNENLTTGRGFLFHYSVINSENTDSPETSSTPQITSTSATTMSEHTSPTEISLLKTTSEASLTSISSEFTKDTSSSSDVLSTKNVGAGTDGQIRRGNKSAAVGGGVGAAALLVIVAIVFIIVVLLRRRRDANQNANRSDETNNNGSPGVNHSEHYDLQMSIIPAGQGTDEYNDTAETVDFLTARQVTDKPEYSLAEDVGGDYSQYTLAEEITTNADHSAVEQPIAGGEYDLADEYQLAGATGEEYENFESMKRADEEQAITDEYADVMASMKKENNYTNKATDLVENDLYGT